MSLRIAFIGCVASSAVALQALLDLAPGGVEVVGLITRRASTFNADFHDLSPLAQGLGIPVLYAEEAPDDSAQAEWLLATAPFASLGASSIFRLSMSLGPTRSLCHNVAA